MKTDKEWKESLTPEQYRVLRQKGTEAPFTGEYWNTSADGVYKCAGCGQELFTSESKFDSGCGWPSFDASAGEGKVKEAVDSAHGMRRTEILCSRCDGHLGHVFDDGPTETGLRYCVNSVSVKLEPKKNEPGK
jgi:methionine-R-sulfoxide reductase